MNKPLSRKLERELEQIINGDPKPLKSPKSYTHDPNLHLKRTYGITSEDKQQMLESQQCCCAICFKDITTTSVVDHCHTTGNIRGLLCQTCNLLLGMAKDTEQILLNAVQYLKASKN